MGYTPGINPGICNKCKELCAPITASDTILLETQTDYADIAFDDTPLNEAIAALQRVGKTPMEILEWLCEYVEKN